MTIGFLLVMIFVFHQAFADQVFSKRNWDDNFTAHDCDLRKDLMDKHFVPDENQAFLFAQNDPLFKSVVGTENYSLSQGPYELTYSPKCGANIPTFDVRFMSEYNNTRCDLLFVTFDSISYKIIQINSEQMAEKCLVPAIPQPLQYDIKKWNTLNITGEFTNSKPPKPPQLFNFPYAVINGTMENINSNQAGSVVATIKSNSNGMFVIQIPRNYPTTDYIAGIDKPIVLDNENEIIYNTVTKDCFYETRALFSGDSSIKVIFKTNHLIVGGIFHGENVPQYCLDKTLAGFHNSTLAYPLPQFRTGTDFDEITCKQGYALVSKLEDGNPACVKADTVQELVSRGWASSSINKLVIHGFDDVYKIGNKIGPTIIFHGLRDDCAIPHVVIYDSDKNMIWQSTKDFCISPTNLSYASQKYQLDSKLGGPLAINQTGSYKAIISYQNMTVAKKFMVIPYLH
jgi:hypothetical protein